MTEISNSNSNHEFSLFTTRNQINSENCLPTKMKEKKRELNNLLEKVAYFSNRRHNFYKTLRKERIFPMKTTEIEDNFHLN